MARPINPKHRGEPEEHPDNLHPVVIWFNDQSYGALLSLRARGEGSSATTVAHHAVVMLDMLLREVHDNGSKVLIERPDGAVYEWVFRMPDAMRKGKKK